MKPDDTGGTLRTTMEEVQADDAAKGIGPGAGKGAGPMRPGAAAPGAKPLVPGAAGKPPAAAPGKPPAPR